LKKYILTALKFLIFLGLGILLTWLAVKDIPEKDKPVIIQAILDANYGWVALAMMFGILAHLSRAIRWKMFFAPLGYTPKTTNTFYAVMIGYLGNLGINRLGEVLRCTILKRYEKIPLTQSFGTVIVERFIDTFILLLVFIISIFIQYEKLQGVIAEKITSPLKLKLHSYLDNKPMLILIFGILLCAVVCGYLFRNKIRNSSLAKKIQGLLFSFWEGIRSVSKMKSPFLFIFHTIFIWIMYLMSVYVCVFAFDETRVLTLTDCLTIMAFGSLGVIATPGGIGAYQIIVQALLPVLHLTFLGANGLATPSVIAFGWVAWLAQIVVVIVFGLLSFGLLAIFNKEEGLEE
jgi:hypothetical protein